MTNTILFENKGNVKMIAHRGVSGLELENTCPAFVAAGVKSYYGIETDVHVTKDGKYIVIHDDDTLRVTGVNFPVEQTDFATLRALTMKDTDGKTERKDLFLPTLEEYISICKKYDKVSVLELKCAMEEKHVVGIANVIKEMGWLEKTIFISFEGLNLVYLKKHFPSVSAQFLTCDATEENLRFMIDNDLDADLCGYCVSKEYVDKLHAAGKKVNCWTIDKLEHAEYMQACGVDFITSNILE
jgi:glycerophosphoryl diester phosphodiesterase